MNSSATLSGYLLGVKSMEIDSQLRRHPADAAIRGWAEKKRENLRRHRKGRMEDLSQSWTVGYLYLPGQWLTFSIFGDSIFSRENKVQTFISGSIG